LAQDILLPVFRCEGVTDDFARNAAAPELQALGLSSMDQVERFKFMIGEYPLPSAPFIDD
jgi:hypothetical protein